MENGILLSDAIAHSWAIFDFPCCLALLQEALRLNEQGTDASVFMDVAKVLLPIPPRFDCVIKEHHALAASCLDMHAEILRIAATLDPLYAVAALRSLIERNRIEEGLAQLSASLHHPDFPDVASLACTALFGQGKREEALSLLRDRQKDADCHYIYVTELVKIGRLTGYSEKEFSALDQSIQSGKKPTLWEIAYYSQLGIALEKQAHVMSALNRLAAQPDLVLATSLACVELHLDGLNLDDAFSLLQAAGKNSPPHEWYDALQRKLEQLVAAHIGSHEWQKAKASLSVTRAKVALTLSGFVRSYEGLASLFDFLQRHVEKWDIEIFAQSFDRLGNLYMRTQNLGNVFYDYSHGGFYREIMKTPPLRIDTLYSLLSPVCLQIEKRQQDEHYVKSIGMSHPQWSAVWEAWQIFERYQIQTGNEYALAIRGRYDKDYAHIDLDRLDLRDNQIATPANDFYGRPPYTINDQFAIGSVSAVATYCRIGEKKNFKQLEDTHAWKNECAGAEFSHETHLALWLRQNGIEIVRPDWLLIDY